MVSVSQCVEPFHEQRTEGCNSNAEGQVEATGWTQAVWKVALPRCRMRNEAGSEYDLHRLRIETWGNALGKERSRKARRREMGLIDRNGTELCLQGVGQVGEGEAPPLPKGMPCRGRLQKVETEQSLGKHCVDAKIRR
jgi:hypothetical protein